MFSTRVLLTPALLAAILSSAGRLLAQTDYQWQDSISGGLWSTPGNWSPSGPASGSTNTADFSTLTLPANNTVHLNAPETIGGVIFADQGNAYNWTLDNNGSSANVLTLGGGAAITVDNGAATIGAVLGGSAGLTLNGSPALGLNGQVFANTAAMPGVTALPALALNPAAVESYSGATSVSGVALTLDFSNLSTPTNMINSGSALTLTGGSLGVLDQTGGAATSQAFNGLSLGAGGAAVSVAANGNTNAGSTMALGAISRVAGGAVNFILPTTGSITTTTPNTSGILGGWATATAGGAMTWATSASNGVSPGAIGGLPAAGYSLNTLGPGLNSSLTSNVGISADAETNSLDVNSPSSSAGVTDSNSSNTVTLTIDSGGILMTPNVGPTAINGLVYGGTNEFVTFNVTTANPQNDLIINQMDPNGAFENLAEFTDNASAVTLVKNGPGLLLMIGGNGNSGPTVINQGGRGLLGGPRRRPADPV